ncbi:DUF6544 family protein [Paludibacter jiangxiensis]|uniref:Uncharacterized protein n=1 Tax=Paludibacter jiangxiensis TaxID=681398 RepID=A0A161L8S2_9BACT|nr:DUF6544 family protein [Paludibacter jiangxiensis]GAT63624.1 hypothetical protein PJIAN_4163 [Paludibacter jiangxiensis]
MILRILFALLIIVHGLLHSMGFAKAFGYAFANQSIYISTSAGYAWLISGLLFLAASWLFIAKKKSWWIAAVIAVICSQVLIISAWQDARFGTIANTIILFTSILAGGSVCFEEIFRHDARKNLKHNSFPSSDLLTEKDMHHLPEPVKRYLRYVGVVNKPKVKNFRVVFEGEMRDKGKDFFPFVAEQYNFFANPARLFFMKGRMFGIEVPGYHKYTNAKARMDIRLFGLIPVIKKSGPVMDKTETVTLLNDMCLLAPASLIDKRIEWQPINDSMTKAIFTNENITVSAILYFNAEGQLVNFTSNDRTAIAYMKEFPFSTPVTEYKNINGYNLISKGDAVWHYPDGKFVYGKFTLKEIQYNRDYID